jgi:hypothetical protein
MLTPWDPLGYKVAHFRQSRRLVLANSQAAGPLWEFRWGSSLGLCYVTRVTLKGFQIGNMAAQELGFNLTAARSFTLADATNTASILRTLNKQKLNTASSVSILSEFRETNSATAAAGGTYTQDTDPMAIGAYSTVATPTIDGSSDVLFDFKPAEEADQLLRLNANEGFLVNSSIAAPASTAFVLYLEVAWAEATKP